MEKGMGYNKNVESDITESGITAKRESGITESGITYNVHPFVDILVQVQYSRYRIYGPRWDQ